MLSLADGSVAAVAGGGGGGAASFVVPRIKIEPPPPSDSPCSDSPPPGDETSETTSPAAAGALTARGLSLDSALDGDDGETVLRRACGGGGATMDLRSQPGKFKKCLHHRFLHQAHSEERAAAAAGDGPYGQRHDTKRSRSFDYATIRRGRGGGGGAAAATDDDDDGYDDYDHPLDLSVTRSSLDIHVTTATRNIFEARARERHMRRRSESDDAPSADLLRAWLDAPGGSDQRLASASSRFSYSDLQLSVTQGSDGSIGEPNAHGQGHVGGGLTVRSQQRHHHHYQYRLAAAAPPFNPYVRPAPLQQQQPPPPQQQHASAVVKCASFSDGVGVDERDAIAADNRVVSVYAPSSKLSPCGLLHRLDSDAAAAEARPPGAAAVAFGREFFPGLASRPTFCCPHCQQTFPAYDSLAKHVSKHLPMEAHVAPAASLSVALCGGGGGSGVSGGGGGGVGGRLHSCKVCDRSFSRSDMLTRHMRLHTGLKPYECQLCGQLFSRSDHLNTHQRTHTGERPYRCPHCLYSACRRDMITRHMRIHGRDLKAKRRRMLMYLRSERGGGGSGSLSSGADSYESSSGGASRSANSSADSGSFESAAAVVAAAAAAAAYSGEPQWAAHRLLLPPRGDGLRQRDWLGGSLWNSLAIAGVAEGNGVGAAAAAAATAARRLLSPSWSRTSSESVESDSSCQRPAPAAKSRTASPRDAYSDSFESDAGASGSERQCELQTRRTPSSPLPAAPSAAAATSAPARRGLVRQDASLELEEAEDAAHVTEWRGRGHDTAPSSDDCAEWRAAALAAGAAAYAAAVAHPARGTIKFPGMPTETTPFGCAAPQPPPPPPQHHSHLGLEQPSSSLRAHAGAPPRQSSLSDDLVKCKVNE